MTPKPKYIFLTLQMDKKDWFTQNTIHVCNFMHLSSKKNLKYTHA